VGRKHLTDTRTGATPRFTEWDAALWELATEREATRLKGPQSPHPLGPIVAWPQIPHQKKFQGWRRKHVKKRKPGDEPGFR
jgi:hypothetical protein